MTNIFLPSASSLPRTMACPDSELLIPAVVEEQRRDATHGIAVHSFILALGQGKTKAEALDEMGDDPSREACEALDENAIPRGGHFELALAWNHTTGVSRILGHDIGRDYSKADRAVEYVGSFDYVAEVRPRHGVVVDWKTGWLTIPAKDSWQLLFGAVASASHLGWDSVTVAHLDLRDTEHPRWDIAEVDGLALAAARQKLRTAAERSLTGRVEPVRVVEGSHCRYCPAFKVCPAKTALTRALVTDLAALPQPFGALTMEKAREAVLLLERYEGAAKRAWLELEAFASVNPIDLGDGRVMKLSPGREADKVTDPGRAIDALTEVLDEEHAHLAITVTKGGIEKAAAAFAKKFERPIGTTKETAVEHVRDRGALQKERAKESVKIVKVDR